MCEVYRHVLRNAEHSQKKKKKKQNGQHSLLLYLLQFEFQACNVRQHRSLDHWGWLVH